MAGELADLTNVLVVHRMTNASLARQLAAAAVDPAALRDGEFVLAVKDPPRLVPSRRGRPGPDPPVPRGAPVTLAPG